MNSLKSQSEITGVMITQSSHKEGCYFKKWNFTKKKKERQRKENKEISATETVTVR